ncbi:hypothetical protein AKJ18_35300, partial [Vibrio xuii]
FNAPEKANLMVHTTSVNGLDRYYFMDGSYQQVAARESMDNKFDPRLRPWFDNASIDGKIRLTEPYFFYFLETSGVTLSRRSHNGRLVVGADFTLDALSQQISKLGNS